MKGKVIAAREAVIPLVVIDDQGGSWEIDCVVDTACTAELTLPPDAIQAIALPWSRSAPAEIAGGRIVECPRYKATLLWNGGRREVEVVELDDEPLVGMALLEEHRLTMDVRDGGDVEIAPLTAR